MKNQKFISKIIFFYALFALCFTLSAKEVTLNEATSVAQSFMNSQLKGTTIDSISILRDTNNQIIGYVAMLNPIGYIVLSNNTDIYPIISYSEKSNFTFKEVPNNILLHFVIWDLEARNKALPFKSLTSQNDKTLNNSTWNNYLNKNFPLKSTGEIFGPLITTNWHQRGIFNTYCPIDPLTENRCIVGCVATATSQIINFWRYPKKMTFDSSDKYTSYGKNGNIISRT